MESAQPSADPVDLNLLRAWREPLTAPRIARDVVGSLFVHALVLAFLIFAPDAQFYSSYPRILTEFRKPTILYAPPSTELTQRAPNKGKVLKELDERSAVQEQPAQAPHVRRFTPPPGAPARGPQPLTIQSAQIEAPQLETGAASSQLPSLGTATSGLGTIQSLGAPPKQPAPAAPAKSPAPRPDPLREALRAGGGGITVGDLSEDSPRVPGMIPSQCTDCSALQLLSDPKNVDFKPYLLQVLAVVKRNWMSVIPQSARMGRRGIVVLKFIIDRHGAVPQLEFSSPTGSDFDRAAVAGISASVPFPPFPPGFNGDQIHLQMAFAYNEVPH